ncbi:hypothetical protein BQ8482_800008 [Mesorhizobium delmotii]|uniref:Uncharacterized protein n=1 Tax=Mesorhizobium delmotii TaxID=1631247 RepID=A0A2P9AWU6_9HYPH|nr:hypothetical protein BQ8482_800008 [Mesorhizobium delmotii]
MHSRAAPFGLSVQNYSTRIDDRNRSIYLYESGRPNLTVTRTFSGAGRVHVSRSATYHAGRNAHRRS